MLTDGGRKGRWTPRCCTACKATPLYGWTFPSSVPYPRLPLCPRCPASLTQDIDGRRAFVGRGGEQESRRGAWSWSSSGAPPRACLLVAGVLACQVSLCKHAYGRLRCSSRVLTWMRADVDAW